MVVFGSGGHTTEMLKLLESLENGVSQYPKLEGRFPCVSGVQFRFDPALEPMHRVVAGSVQVGVREAATRCGLVGERRGS